MIRIVQEVHIIPTYGIGLKDKNPMFFEKRVYQGSSGKVYPFPVIDKIEDAPKDKPHRVVVMENDYLLVWIMPDLGGRIYRALDKTNGYDFVYYNEVVKPALVGLTGPWISGGIEFNWPQHHRPTTYEPVNFHVEQGEGFVRMHLDEIDRMYGTRAQVTYTLYEGKAYIEIAGDLYNRTGLPQTFLWWANPAVAVNQHTQSVFPPDVTAVFDHGKRDVSAFPIAHGTYYKANYTGGVDISQYKNIPVPTSYMAFQSAYDFVGGYDFSVQAGMLHVADHHIAPGKKQWTWGNGDFGRTWDDNLTDANGPYIELMAGVYTDNQPDFSWLAPYESKRFVQYFMPYKELGLVKNATQDVVLNVEANATGFAVSIYASACFDHLCVRFETPEKSVHEEYIESISPLRAYHYQVPQLCQPNDRYIVSICEANGATKLRYENHPISEKIPVAAAVTPKPAAVGTVEELVMIATHLEQYRHATYRSEDYYLEGLRRDPFDSRINTGYGHQLLLQGRLDEAKVLFDRAISRLWMKNERTRDSEPLYLKALVLEQQGQVEEAVNWYQKASWSLPQHAAAQFRLGLIAIAKADSQLRDGYASEAVQSATRALAFLDESLSYNSRNRRAIVARIVAYRLTRQIKKARQSLRLARASDCMDPTLYYEQCLLMPSKTRYGVFERRLANTSIHDVLELANDYSEMGLWENAIDILRRYLKHAVSPSPLAHYHLSYYFSRLNMPSESEMHALLGETADPGWCFPNRPASRIALEYTVSAFAFAAMAKYYLGNLDYDRGRYDRAIRLWEESAARLLGFATVHRNLGIAYFNKLGHPKQAVAAYERALAADPNDSRLFYEYDQLLKRTNTAPSKRLQAMENCARLIQERDDLYLEYVAIHNLLGNPERALALLSTHRFHVWEGGEGKVAFQYVIALMKQARRLLANGDVSAAINRLQACRTYPKNLGEGKLPGTMENHIDYLVGVACSLNQDPMSANVWYERASIGLQEVKDSEFYNDQPSDTIYFQGLALRKLGREEEALVRFRKLSDYADQHLNQTVEIDYFTVSLPNHLIFNDDLQRRNKAYCTYLLALARIGENRLDEVPAIVHTLRTISPDFQGLYDFEEEANA